ncbi:MAG: beta-propeller fold lactonase family protein, partial [Bacteroidota bacterium]
MKKMSLQTITKTFKFGLLSFSLMLFLAACDDDPSTPINPGTGSATDFIGAVYAMTNGNGQGADATNSVVAYGRNEDGTLELIGTFGTGGQGGDFDGPEGLDPLISAYALTKSDDNRFVFATNAGSNTISVFRVNDDFSLSLTDQAATNGVGPNSIAYYNGIVYVSNIDADGTFNGEPDQEGNLYGYRIDDSGNLSPISGSTRVLANRPSAIQFSPNGDFLAVTSINSGSSALASGSEDELVIYAVGGDGTLSVAPTDAATSTLRGNAEGRNLPSAIGFQIVGDNYVIVTEAREFQPDGTPPAFTALQSGSVSTWQINADGSLTAISQDVASGDRATESGRTACWIDFANSGDVFFVSNAIEAGLASFGFDNGNVWLMNEIAAVGTGAGTTTDPGQAFRTTEGWIDLWISDDGRHL